MVMPFLIKDWTTSGAASPELKASSGGGHMAGQARA